MKFYRILSRIDAAKFKAAEFAVNFAVCKILRRRNFIVAEFLNLYRNENFVVIKFRKAKRKRPATI